MRLAAGWRTMIADWETWACAQHLLDRYGPLTDSRIEERMAALARAGDKAGISTWLAIADRVDRLRDEIGTAQARH